MEEDGAKRRDVKTGEQTGVEKYLDFSDAVRGGHKMLCKQCRFELVRIVLVGMYLWGMYLWGMYLSECTSRECTCWNVLVANVLVRNVLVGTPMAPKTVGKNRVSREQQLSMAY